LIKVLAMEGGRGLQLVGGLAGRRRGWRAVTWFELCTADSFSVMDLV